MAKIHSYTIGEFMAGEHHKSWVDRRITKERIEKWVKTAIGFTVPVTTGLFTGSHVFAAAPTAVTAGVSVAGTQALILKAFDPLIQLIVSLSYPIAGLMIAGGCLLIMIQQREQGFKMLQNAALGYVLVQLSPLLLKILVGVSTGVVM